MPRKTTTPRRVECDYCGRKVVEARRCGEDGYICRGCDCEESPNTNEAAQARAEAWWIANGKTVR